jgi:hypothetical protein
MIKMPTKETKTIYALNSKLFSKKRYLKNWFKVKRSNGPSEVWKNLVEKKSEKILIVNKNKKTWPKNNSRVIFTGDFFDLLPKELIKSLKKTKLFIGPNIDLNLSINYQYLNSFTDIRIIAPCKWVKEYLISNFNLNENKVVVWASGIDISYWKAQNSRIQKKYVVIYIKSDSNYELVEKYVSYLKSAGIEALTVEYGKYNNKDFKNLLEKTLFVIWIGITESQSIAQFQIWSMNVPTFVLKQDKFVIGEKTYFASSSPYLTSNTGLFFEGTTSVERNIELWLERVGSFSPRDWVKANYTNEIAENRLFELFEF